MRVVQVTPTWIYPPDTGGRHRSHGLLVDFVSRGDRVHRICQGGMVSNYTTLNLNKTVEFEENYTESRHLHPAYELTSLPVRYDYAYSFIDIALSLFPPPNFERRIKWADVVLVEGPWQLEPVKRVAESTPVVYSSHNVEAQRHAPLDENLLGKVFLRRAKAVESKAIKHCDVLVCTSERDLRTYERDYDFDAETIVLSNGTYRDSIERTIDSGRLADVRNEIGLSADASVGIFVGSNYRPNVEAVELLQTQIRSDDRWNDIELLIVGEVCDRVRDVPDNVHLLGFVEDLEAYISAADFCLNPIVSGSGSNIKMLDYFARGTPVVTTPFGARGLDLTDREDAFVANIEHFIDEITYLLDNPETASTVASNAREKVKKRYTWEHISAEYRDSLVQVLSHYSNS